MGGQTAHPTAHIISCNNVNAKGQKGQKSQINYTQRAFLYLSF